MVALCVLICISQAWTNATSLPLGPGLPTPPHLALHVRSLDAQNEATGLLLGPRPLTQLHHTLPALPVDTWTEDTGSPLGDLPTSWT